MEHAVRILGSYQAGEELNIEIMRDKRKQTIDVVMPDNRSSWVGAPVAPAPVVATEKIVVPGDDRI